MGWWTHPDSQRNGIAADAESYANVKGQCPVLREVTKAQNRLSTEPCQGLTVRSCLPLERSELAKPGLRVVRQAIAASCMVDGSSARPDIRDELARGLHLFRQ